MNFPKTLAAVPNKPDKTALCGICIIWYIFEHLIEVFEFLCIQFKQIFMFLILELTFRHESKRLYLCGACVAAFCRTKLTHLKITLRFFFQNVATQFVYCSILSILIKKIGLIISLDLFFMKFKIK